MLSDQEIRQLEKKWFGYKLKEQSRKALFTAGALIVVGSGIFLYTYSAKIPLLLKEVKKELPFPKKSKEQKEQKTAKAEPKKNSGQKKQVLALNTKFLENIQKNPPKPSTVHKKKEEAVKFKKPDIKALSLTEIEEEKPKIRIESKKVDTLTFLKKKFEATKKADYALMVAEEYYEKKNYKKALKWAIKANDADASNEKSWILFAKSKTKLGRKKEAIKALKIYLQNRESQRVFNILEQIRSGDLRG